MKKLIIFALFIGALAGCRKDALDITPDGRMLVEDIFKTEINAEAYLNTVYSCIPRYFKFYAGFQFLAGLTDEGEDSEIGNSPSVASQWSSGSLTPGFNPLAAAGPGPGGEYNDFYRAFWRGIYLSNVFLTNIENTPFQNPEKKKREIAEARLLRAFFYLELCKQFGPMPIVTKPFETNFDYSSLVRPTFQEVTDFVIAECNEAINEPALPLAIGLANEISRFSKAVAYALKSQVALYNASPLWNPTNDAAKWAKATSESKEALQALTAAGYKLTGDYGGYFLGSRAVNIVADKETIFEIANPWTIPLTTIGIPSKEGSWTIGAQPTQELVDAYDMATTGEPAITGYEDADHLKPIINAASGYDPANPYEDRDPRFYATVWYNGAIYNNINGKNHTVETFIGGADQLIKSPPNRINTHTGYYLRKFIDPALPINYASGAQFKKYRLAEVYLNLAEAENEANGPTTVAYDAVNAVRNRAGMKSLPAGLDKTALRERIRRERRVELAWEEHRFWDVRRWKILGQTDKLVTGMEIKGGSGGSGKVALPDPGFESGGAAWFFSANTTIQPIEGHTSAHVVEMSNGGQVGTKVSGLTPNTTYEVSVTMLVKEGMGYMGAREFGAAGEVLIPTVPADGVKIQKAQFTTGASSTTAVIFSWWPDGAQGMVDDFSLTRISSGSEPSTPTTYTRFVVSRRNAWQDKFLIFPIPIGDASIIPDFTKNQNPGW